MLRDNQLALPVDLSMLFKVFLTLDGCCRQINPDFYPVAEAKPCVRNAMIMRHTRRRSRNTAGIVCPACPGTC